MLAGNRGSDLLDGGTGDDRFVWSFGDGADRILGGADRDTLAILGTVADDYLSLRIDGDGVVVGSVDAASTELQVSDVELIDVRCDDGADILSVGDQSAVTEVVFGGGRGADILDGGQALFALRADGSADDDTLVGGAGNDSLAGGGDDDVLLGGEGLLKHAAGRSRRRPDRQRRGSGQSRRRPRRRYGERRRGRRCSQRRRR